MEEEKKIVLPKPPKELQQVQHEETRPEVEPIAVTEPTEIQPEVVEEKRDVPPAKKRKLNFEPVTNWVGLFVSLAVLGLFVYLLVI